MNKHLKRFLITVLILALLGGGTYGGLMLAKNVNTKPVNVYAVMDFSTQNYDQSVYTSSGLVRMENMQKIYLSETQSVNEVYVKEGQSVKAGDKILSFDTTLSRLDVEKAEVALEKERMELENNKKVLEQLQYAHITENIDATLASLQAQLEAAYASIPEPEYPKLPRGKWTAEKPYYMENPGVFSAEELFEKSKKDDIYVVMADGEDGFYYSYYGIHLFKNGTDSAEEESTGDSDGKKKDGKENNNGKKGKGQDKEPDNTGYSMEFFVPEPLNPKEQEEPPIIAALQAQIDQVSKYYENSYSRAELEELKKTTAQAIENLELSIRMDEVALEKAKAEVDDGVIRASLTGVVKSVLPIEEMGTANDAVLVISGGGGYYITASIGEFDRENCAAGQQVTVNSWESGETLAGEIVEIGERPTENSYGWTSGNNNISWYPVTISVSDDANLREYEYVDVSFDGMQTEADDSLYVEKWMIRSDNQGSYVFKKDENGLLRKTRVVTGKNLWSSYLQIIDGLTADDYVALPYARDAVDGAETVIADPETLWGGSY